MCTGRYQACQCYECNFVVICRGRIFASQLETALSQISGKIVDVALGKGGVQLGRLDLALAADKHFRNTPFLDIFKFVGIITCFSQVILLAFPKKNTY